ncbi:ABC transporter permease [Bombiscardovia coagulans]|uniref:ABC transporter permease n=1 Tax=Bombiscardovia coagulans TaxID=686666 RepID=A0A261EU73_9BIFI|nr:ABC transporter permease [Bombiscardovia coagulans]OZG50422.1 ABC transporter permease [Bombiscardovia coagulans]
MFFLKMITSSFKRQKGRKLLIALTVGLSACVAVAMLGVVFDVGDKLNAELSTYGSNITVQPKSQAVVADLYTRSEKSAESSSQLSTPNAGSATPSAVIQESEVAKIKSIFWAYNIEDFAPRLDITANCNGVSVPIVGTWFHKTLQLDSGGSSQVGMPGLRPWWKVQGKWPRDNTKEAMIGKDLMAELGGKGVGDRLTLSLGSQQVEVVIVGSFDSGDDDSSSLYLPTAVAQELAAMPGQVDRVEVKALTTPENELARKAARNPAALTQDEWETWYCTAYASSIAYQIEEVISGSVAKQVRQVAALQGDVLNKTQAVMLLMTVLSLLAAAVAVANLLASSITERVSEFALLKAVGATDGSIYRLILAETGCIGLFGAIVGSLLGTGMAQIVGMVVFHASIDMHPMVFVWVFVLLALVILLASVSAIRSILRLSPAQALHGR